MVRCCHHIPVAARGLYRRITISGREQQLRCQKLTFCVWLFTPVNATAGKVRFYVDGPREVDDRGVIRFAGQYGGGNGLRGGRRECIARRDEGRRRVGRFQWRVISVYWAADYVKGGPVGFGRFFL